MSLLDYFTGIDSEAETKRGQEADAAIARQNQLLLDQGRIDAETFYKFEQNRLGNETGDVSKQVNAAFVEGLKEGPANVRKGIGGIIDTLTSLIPWQLWLIGVGVAFVYLGGLVWLKGRLAK